MTQETNDSTEAGMRLDVAPDLADLAGITAWLLSQTGAHILAVDLALDGPSLRYRTDLGTLDLVVDGRDVRLVCDTRDRGTPEIGRILCVLWVRRLIERCRVTEVTWGPSRRPLDPAGFAAASRNGAPTCRGHAAADVAPTHYVATMA